MAAQPDAFALPHSALNRFLYADIGLAGGAGTLTVVSLFGQRGEDPWDAAARLARLPARAAVATLAAAIAEAPAHPRSLEEATAMAEGLVALLPGPAEESRVRVARPQPRWLPFRWPVSGLPPNRWPSVAAAGLAVLVVCVWLWQLLAGALG